MTRRTLAALVFVAAVIYTIHEWFFAGIPWTTPFDISKQPRLAMTFIVMIFAVPFLRYAVHGYFFDQDARGDSSGGADCFGDSD